MEIETIHPYARLTLTEVNCPKCPCFTVPMNIPSKELDREAKTSEATTTLQGAHAGHNYGHAGLLNTVRHRISAK